MKIEKINNNINFSKKKKLINLTKKAVEKSILLQNIYRAGEMSFMGASTMQNAIEIWKKNKKKILKNGSTKKLNKIRTKNIDKMPYDFNTENIFSSFEEKVSLKRKKKEIKNKNNNNNIIFEISTDINSLDIKFDAEFFRYGNKEQNKEINNFFYINQKKEKNITNEINICTKISRDLVEKDDDIIKIESHQEKDKLKTLDDNANKHSDFITKTGKNILKVTNNITTYIGLTESKSDFGKNTEVVIGALAILGITAAVGTIAYNLYKNKNKKEMELKEAETLPVVTESTAIATITLFLEREILCETAYRDIYSKSNFFNTFNIWYSPYKKLCEIKNYINRSFEKYITELNILRLNSNDTREMVFYMGKNKDSIPVEKIASSLIDKKEIILDNELISDVSLNENLKKYIKENTIKIMSLPGNDNTQEKVLNFNY